MLQRVIRQPQPHRHRRGVQTSTIEIWPFVLRGSPASTLLSMLSRLPHPLSMVELFGDGGNCYRRRSSQLRVISSRGSVSTWSPASVSQNGPLSGLSCQAVLTPRIGEDVQNIPSLYRSGNQAIVSVVLRSSTCGRATCHRRNTSSTLECGSISGKPDTSDQFSFNQTSGCFV